MKQHTVPDQVTTAVRATRLPSECQTLNRWLLSWLLWLLLYWETSNQTSHRLADIRIHVKRFLSASSDCPAFGVKFTLPRHKTCECECPAVAEVCIGLAANLRSICWIRTSISDQWLPIRKTDGVLTNQTTKEKGAGAQPLRLGSLFTAKNRNHQKAPIRWQR